MAKPERTPPRSSEREMELALDRLPMVSAPPARAAAARCTDGELLTRIADGDGEAFEELYGRYSRAVLGLALRRLRDRGRAEDAVQETFTSVWRAASSYRPERGPGAPWLFAVARNAISDRGRARNEPPAEAPDEPSPAPGPDERAEQAWLSFRVHRALEALVRKERELIELAYWGGLSQSEIAERLQIPLGTVKTRTRAALARLADALEEELR
jgi:RNA polymerase sigma-70 factor, ECF subfamily